MSQENKDFIKHALKSIVVATVIALLTSLIEQLTALSQHQTATLSGGTAGLVYFLRSRKIV